MTAPKRLRAVKDRRSTWARRHKKLADTFCPRSRRQPFHRRYTVLRVGAVELYVVGGDQYVADRPPTRLASRLQIGLVFPLRSKLNVPSDLK